MEQRQLDQLVRTITRELADGSMGAAAPQETTPPAAADQAVPAGTGTGGPCVLIDNWRVRESERDAFLAYYRRYVAEVIQRLPGYRSGRILVAPPGADYTWHVQAFYEFESPAVRDIFAREFDRQVRRVDPRMSLEKVLDGMDRWVLAHEDGVLTEVWR